MKLLYFAMELAEDEMLKLCENDFEKMKLIFWIKMCITFCFFSKKKVSCAVYLYSLCKLAVCSGFLYVKLERR